MQKDFLVIYKKCACLPKRTNRRMYIKILETTAPIARRRKETIPSEMDKRDIYSISIVKTSAVVKLFFRFFRCRVLCEELSDFRRESDRSIDRVFLSAGVQHDSDVPWVLMDKG